MKRSYNNTFAQKKMTSYAPSYARRPFKRVRADGTGLVLYGRSQLYTQARRPFTVSNAVRNIRKGVDTLISNGSIEPPMNDNQNIRTLNLIAPGTGSWNRIGRLIEMKSIRIRLTVTAEWNRPPFTNGNPGMATPPNPLDTQHFRMVLVYDKQPNGTVPMKNEIFQVKDYEGTETGYWNGFLAYDNMERFIILRDETITFEPPTRVPIVQYEGSDQTTNVVNYTFPPVNHEKLIDIYHKLNLRTNYKAESQMPTISDIATGALYLVFMSDSYILNGGASVTPNISVEGAARLRYIDQ